MDVIASRRPPAAEVEMARRRWSIWLGLPVALVAIGLILSRFQAGAEAGGRKTAPPAGACAASPIATTGAGKPDREVGAGSWWRIADRQDEDGALAGRQLTVGRGGAATRTLDLRIESAASGPVGGVIVVTNDDGRRSEVMLAAAADGCAWLVDESQDVVRGAILDPADGSVLAHLVDRETRADLGTWRFGSGGLPSDLAEPELVAPPPAIDALGPIWATDLRLDPAGTTLAVQSCGEERCQTRLFDLRAPDRAPVVVAGEQGRLIGFAGPRLVTWAACPLIPCAVVAWDPAPGEHRTILDRAEAAAVTPDGRYLVATFNSQRGRTMRIELATGVRAILGGLAADEAPLSSDLAATSGLQVALDEVAIGSPGANPRPFRPSAAEVVP